MSIYVEILEWSKTRPAWQRDALRRLLAGPLEAKDFEELEEQCVAAHSEEEPPASQPLSADHLPQQGDSAVEVSLKAIHSVRNVGILAEDQDLTFAPSGLNVIYGDNGSGKSSYARILKRLCRARGTESRLESNVFSDEGGLPTVAVEFVAGGKDQSVVWSEGGEDRRPEALSRVWVFDSAAAHAYVAEKNDLPFQPAGLDLMQKLAAACDELRNRIEARCRRAAENAKKGLPQVPANTKVAELLRDLSASTRYEDVERLATLSSEEVSRMQRLQVDVARLESNSTAKEATRIRAMASRVRDLGNRLADINEALSDQAIEALATLRDKEAVTRRAAELASSAIFGSEPLPGTGSKEWKELWRAARLYAETCVHIGKLFPSTDEGARCVLCQQELGEEAKRRLVRFDQFVRDKVAESAAETSRRLDEAVTKLSSMITGLDGATVAEIRAEDERLAADVVAYLETADARRRIAIGTSDSVLPTFPRFVTERVESLAKRLEGRAKELEKQVEHGTQLSVRAELDELMARHQLALNRQQVCAAIEQLKLCDRLTKGLGDTDSTPVTRKAKELSKRLVTDALKNAFARELGALGVSSESLDLIPSGAKGKLNHQVGLQGAKRGSKVDYVLSEGECRAVALAGFFAELSIHPVTSAVVLDDPASSFDHLRRGRVAERIVREAASRQVIVFTHDIVFLVHLQDHAKQLSVDLNLMQVERRGRVAGVATFELPWVGKNVNQRLGGLMDEIGKLRQLHKEVGRTEYEVHARKVYDLLRSTWERAIESELFAGAIERFRRSIETKKLRDVILVQSDYDRIERGMAKASCWITGHDQAGAINEPVPEPEEILRDINELKDWVADIRRRREKRRRESKQVRGKEEVGASNDGLY